jgi:hypothetical protein
VPDGWLVSYKYFGGRYKSANCITYFSDKEREWNSEEIKWDLIYETRGANEARMTYRMEVPGGWLVRDGYNAESRSVNGNIGHLNLSMTFVPDKDHVWESGE